LAVSTAPTNITATPGPNSGEATLSWNQGGTVERYALVYGLNSGNYTMGLLDFPSDNRSITVHNLVPGQRYFFQVWSYEDPNGGAAASQEISVVAK